MSGAALARVAGGRRSYVGMLYAGCTTGVLAGTAVAAAEGLDASRFALAATALLIPAFAGARLLFVLQHADVFRAEPRRVWRRSEGGSSLYGGLLLAVAVSVPALRVADLPFWSFWDAASVTMLVGLVLTRFGCLMNGCCAGRLSVPTPLLEAGWATIVLAGALALRGSARPGELFAAVVVSYAAGRMVLEPTRQSPAAANVVLSAVLVIGGGVLLLNGGL